MRIGDVGIGIYRGIGNAGFREWKKYLKPRNMVSDSSNYKYYYRWLCFYFCKLKKCDKCGKSNAGYQIWSLDGKKVVMNLCHDCYYHRSYKSKDGFTYCGYNAWLHEQFDNATENEIEAFIEKVEYRMRDWHV